jgi:fumarate hydratase subunit beta
MKTHRLQLPVSEAQIRELKAGDMVILDGEIVMTAGLPTHGRIKQYLDEGKALPTDFQGGSLFHMGSYSREVNGKFEVLYMNPTTSTRFSGYMPDLIPRLGLRITGGKGGLSHESAVAMQKFGCVYLSMLGGGAPLHSAAIREIVSVSWPDLIFQYRLVRMRVEGFGPLTVGIDAHGNSLYDMLHDKAEGKLEAIMAELNATRAPLPAKA